MKYEYKTMRLDILIQLHKIMERTRFTKFLERYCDVHSFFSKLPRMDLVMLILTTSVALIHMILSFLSDRAHLKQIMEQVNGYFSFGHYLEYLMIFFPSFSSFFLYVKRKKHSRMVHKINMIGESLKIRKAPSKYTRLHYFFAIFLILEFSYEFKTEGYHLFNVSDIYTFYTLRCLTWLAVWQFAEQFAVIRFYYQELSEHLSVQWVEKLVECHEALGSCCAILCECYLLQLTILNVYTFIQTVSYVYLIIYSYLSQRTLGAYHYIYIVWTILYWFFTWFIVYSCAETKYVKKILRHFLLKFNDFTAMGMFNFDYPLLYSMVSNATTYIVILVQFSANHEV
ncbi:Gustatory receptor 149 [Halyomorpha halys]|nr:Gustatory receptor 149 [Halyomorpha halys]